MALTHTNASGQLLAVPEKPGAMAVMMAKRHAKAARARVVPLRPELLERGFWAQPRLL